MAVTSRVSPLLSVEHLKPILPSAADCLFYSRQPSRHGYFSAGEALKVRSFLWSMWLVQVATGEPSSLSITTKPCSSADASRAGPPSRIFPIPPDPAYGASATRTLRTQRVRAAVRAAGGGACWLCAAVAASLCSSEEEGPAGEQPAEPVGERQSQDSQRDASQCG